MSLFNSIVQIELGGKVPLLIICMPTNNVICIKGKQCLVQCHIRYLTIKLLHDKIKLKQANWKRRIRVVSLYKIRRMIKKRPQLTIHIAYQVLLEIKLLGQIQKSIFNPHCWQRDVLIWALGWIGLTDNRGGAFCIC